MHAAEQAAAVAPGRNYHDPSKSSHIFREVVAANKHMHKLQLGLSRCGKSDHHLPTLRADSAHLGMRLRGGSLEEEDVIPLTTYKLHGRMMDVGVPAQRLSDKRADRIIQQVSIPHQRPNNLWRYVMQLV
jgi:hypothetical protein